MKRAEFVAEGHLVVVWSCPKCADIVESPFDISDIQGGCTGHFGEDEYCYCPDKEFRKTLECATCSSKVEVTT